MVARVRAAPYCSAAAEDLCFNNYCDIGARVRKANQGRCVYELCRRTDGRTRPTDRQTGSQRVRARYRGPERGGTRRSCVNARSLLQGGCPLHQDGLLAFLHHRAAAAPASLPPRRSPARAHALLRVGEQLANTRSTVLARQAALFKLKLVARSRVSSWLFSKIFQRVI